MGKIEVDPTLILFLGGIGGNPVEDMIAGAHRAIARDTLERARRSGAFSKRVLVTDVVELLARSSTRLLRVTELKSPFMLVGGAFPCSQPLSWVPSPDSSLRRRIR